MAFSVRGCDGARARARALLGIAQQTPQFGNEIVDVLELPVDRCKADIGDIVERMELFHHLLTDHAGGDLLFTRLLEIPLQIVEKPFHGIDTDVQFFHRPQL